MSSKLSHLRTTFRNALAEFDRHLAHSDAGRIAERDEPDTLDYLFEAVTRGMGKAGDQLDGLQEGLPSQTSVEHK